MTLPPAQPPRSPAPGYPFPVEPPEHPQAVTVLVLGIVGLTVVPFVAPFAWYIGNQALREIDADPGRYGRRDWVNVGRILGIVGTVVLGLVLLMVCGFLATWIATFATVSSSM